VSSTGEQTRQRRTRGSRWIALAGIALALVAVVVVVIVGDPFDGSRPPGGVSDNAAPTSLATVTRRALSSQTQVNATLGYAGASSVRVPTGTPPSAVQQAEQAIATSQGMLQTARASLAADSETLAELQATVTAAREKEAVDCAGDNAAESASAGASASGEGTPSGGASGDGGSGLCASDVQSVASDAQGSSGDAMKLDGDRASIVAAEKALASAEAALSAARSSAVEYGQTSTFTMLPAVGQTIVRGQTLFQISGRPVVLQYSSSHVTGELTLGSVVFEPGPVRVTSVTPAVGASVAPGPVLGITSTTPQVTIALAASEQSSVKAGDPVTITLPSNETTPGVVSSVGSVAKSPSGKGGEGGSGGGGGGGGGPEGGEEGGPTIEVDVALRDPGASGHLDEAPVSVSITTSSVANALVVPVDALLALAGGGYALEVVEGRVRRLEAITLGLFDDAEGLVQVGGPGVAAGQRVVVPVT
jgi:hypothetical protein